MPVTPDEAARRVAAFAAVLSSDEAAAAFAVSWLKEASVVANTYPTPQARMAASGLETRGSHMIGNANTMVQTAGRSVPLGDVLFGAEFGSSVYTQFGPRQQHGYWLFRSADEQATMDDFERTFVDEALAAATRG